MHNIDIKYWFVICLDFIFFIYVLSLFFCFVILKHIYSNNKARILTHAPTSQPDQWVWGLNTIYTTTHIHIPDRQDRSEEKNKIERKIYSGC